MNDILKHRNDIINNISKSFVQEEQITGQEVYTVESLKLFRNDLKKAIDNRQISQEDFEKAMKDLSRLAMRQIIDKNGHKKVVYVKVSVDEKGNSKDEKDFEQGHSVKFTKDGKEHVGKIHSLKFHDKTDKVGTAMVDVDGTKHSVSLSKLEHHKTSNRMSDKPIISSADGKTVITEEQANSSKLSAKEQESLKSKREDNSFNGDLQLKKRLQEKKREDFDKKQKSSKNDITTEQHGLLSEMMGFDSEDDWDSSKEFVAQVRDYDDDNDFKNLSDKQIEDWYDENLKARKEIKAGENNKTGNTKSKDSKSEKLYSLPKNNTVSNEEDFKNLSFELRKKLFSGAGEYSKDSGGYDYSKGIRRHTITISPTADNPNKPKISDFVDKKLSEKLKLLGLKDDAIGIQFRLTGIENFRNNKAGDSKIEELEPQVIIRGHNDGWIFNLPTKTGQKNVVINSETNKRTADDLIYKAIWNLKFDKSRIKEYSEKSSGISHIGIGSAASSSETIHYGGKIDMTDYIKKYGKAELEKELSANYAWKKGGKSNWEIKDNHIVFTDSTFFKYD